jgi:hypothetical protein
MATQPDVIVLPLRQFPDSSPLLRSGSWTGQVWLDSHSTSRDRLRDGPVRDVDSWVARIQADGLTVRDDRPA